MRFATRVVVLILAVAIPSLWIAVPAEATLGPAPTVHVSLATYNAANQAGAASEVVTGTSSSSPVSVVITDGTHSTPVQSVATTNGSYTATFPAAQIAALSDGHLTASASYNEIVDVPTGTASITKDTTPPTLQSSTPANSGYANATGFTFTATANEPLSANGSSITLFDNTGTQVGGLVTSYPSSTSVKVTPGAKLVDGHYTAAVTLIDAAGNTSTTTTGFTLDSTTPNAPVISTPATINASNAAAFTVTGTTTSDATDPATGEPGGTISLKLTDSQATPTSVTGNATILSDGSWSVTVDASALADGLIGYSATVTDRAGNVSTAATAGGSKDTVAPAVRGLAVAPAQMTGTTGYGATVTGSVYGSSADNAALEPNDSVIVSATDGVTTLTAPAVTSDPSGNFSVSIDTSALSEGTITYRATASDAAGNASPTTSTSNVKGTLAVTSTSPTANGVTKNKTTVSVTFNHPILTSGAGTTSTLQVTNTNGTLVAGTVTYSPDHQTVIWTAAGAGMPDAGSRYTASYTAYDSLTADHVSGTWSFTVKTTAPAAPTITDVTNPINAANQAAVVVSGTAAETAGTISVTLGGLHVSTTPDGSGNWSVTIDASGLADGDYTASAIETDPAGNASAAGTLSTTKDATAPGAPTITNLTNPINASNEAAVVVAGTAAELGGTISVSLGGLHAATSPDASGNWSVTIDASSLADGNYTASATQTDTAGNVSAAGTKQTTKAATPPPPASSSITLAPIPAAITTGQTITLSGQVTQGRAAAYGQVTLISVSPSGHSTTWGTITPSSTGHFLKTIAPRTNGYYYAAYQGDSQNWYSQSSVRSEKVAFKVSLALKRRVAGRAYLGGGVYYAPAGVLVKLYRETATHAWVFLGSAKVGSTHLWAWSGTLARGTTVKAVTTKTVDDETGRKIVRITN